MTVIVSLPMVARVWTDVLRRYPDVPPRRLRTELIRQQIGVSNAPHIDHRRPITAFLEYLQAAPQASTGVLMINMKINTFVLEDGSGAMEDAGKEQAE